MRIKISLSPEKSRLSLPVHYNALLHGLIYHNLHGALADWLHGKGHEWEQRHFKLFTFSRLYGSYKISNGCIAYNGPVHFYLSSVDSEVLGSLAEHLLTKPSVRLGSAECRIEEVGVEPPPRADFSRPVRVKALSPITVYSTLTAPDGKKKTYYYAPQEEEWSEQILANLQRKAKALGWTSDNLPEGSWVRPRKVRSADQKIITFKNTVIKGWTGLYDINLPEPYFRLAYDTGLGSKNSAGMGMIAIPSTPNGRVRSEVKK